MINFAAALERFDDKRSDDEQENREEKQWWEVVVRPPEESAEDPREVAEQLYADLHGFGRLSYEVHSSGADVTLKVVAGNQPAAERVARHIQSEVGAQTDVQKASVPIEEEDPLAAAEFTIEKDVVFPLETVRTSTSEVGQLHHLLDSLAADDVRGCYQVVCEPVDDDWTARRARSLPESVPQEQDTEQELKRAGVALVPIVGMSILLSPWPIETAFLAGCALVMAATVGEGVSIPQHISAGDIAREYRDRIKEQDGARSTTSKNAEQTADEILEQAGAPGWRASIRLTVSAENRMVSTDIRDGLVGEIERAFSSTTTGQELSATRSTGSDARDVLNRIRRRQLTDRSTAEVVRRLLGQGTRKDLHVGPGEFGVLGYFPDKDGGGSDAREFAPESADTETLAIPAAAPTYTRTPAIADGGMIDEDDFHVDTDRTVTRTHPEYGEVETKIIERRPEKDNDDYYAGEFTREWVESSQHASTIWVGYSEEDGQIREIGVPISQLRRPSFIAGASGSGKSTFAEILALQHIWGGRGCAVIDPHDDFVDDLLTKIPDHRRDDVIVIDPADLTSDWTHTINFLDVAVDSDHPDYDAAVNDAINDAIGVISQGASNIGDRMEDVLQGVTRGMIVSEVDYTFMDMRDVLRYEEDREQFAVQMANEGHKYIAQFAHDLTEMSNDDLAPVNRLLNKWVLSETAREIIRHTETSIDFSQAIEEDKIILVRNDLSGGIQQLFATAIFSKIWRAARQRPRDERPMYPILIDEVDDIHTEEMALGSKLGNARKYGVGLTLMTQKPKEIDDIVEDIKTNCKLFVAFAAPSDKQARPISNMFDCDLSRLTQLGDYRSLVQLDVDGVRRGPFETDMLAPIPSTLTDAEAEQEIVAPSRQTYGVRRDALDSDDNDGHEPIEPDGGDETVTPVEDFLAAAAEGVEAGVIDEGEHYTFVYQDTPRERLRINPSKSIDALDAEEIDHPRFEEITDYTREAVEDDGTPVIDHGQYTQDVGNCLGVDLSEVSHPRIDVDAGDF